MKKKYRKIGYIIGTLIDNICNYLIIIFCCLQACDVINWEWYYILAPFFVRLGVSISCWFLGNVLKVALEAMENEDNN